MPFVVCHVTKCEDIVGKSNLKRVEVDIGAAEPLVVVTNAPNVRLDTHTAVATVGTEVESGGEVVVIKKQAVGGVMSEGMLADSTMLGWAGGAAGICVQLPLSFAVGSEAPRSKPRLDGGGGGESASAAAGPQKSEKELKAEAKAARKAELAAKKAARIAKKAAGGGGGGGEEGEDDKDGDEEEEEGTA